MKTNIITTTKKFFLNTTTEKEAYLPVYIVCLFLPKDIQFIKSQFAISFKTLLTYFLGIFFDSWDIF